MNCNTFTNKWRPKRISKWNSILSMRHLHNPYFQEELFSNCKIPLIIISISKQCDVRQFRIMSVVDEASCFDVGVRLWKERALTHYDACETNISPIKRWMQTEECIQSWPWINVISPNWLKRSIELMQYCKGHESVKIELRNRQGKYGLVPATKNCIRPSRHYTSNVDYHISIRTSYHKKKDNCVK